MSRKLFFIILVSILILTACAAPQMASEAPAMPAMEMADDFGGSFEEEAAFDESSWAKASNTELTTSGETIQRMVIKNADLSIVVDDPIQKMDSVAALAVEMGGFVVDSNVWQNTLNSGAKVPHANITIRVLAEHLDRRRCSELQIVVPQVVNYAPMLCGQTFWYQALSEHLGDPLGPKVWVPHISVVVQLWGHGCGNHSQEQFVNFKRILNCLGDSVLGLHADLLASSPGGVALTHWLLAEALPCACRPDSFLTDSLPPTCSPNTSTDAGSLQIP